MPDYGLLYGLAQGLKGGLDESRDLKQKAADRAHQQLMERLSLGQAGYSQDPSGNLVKTPDQLRRESLSDVTQQAGLIKGGQKAVLDPDTNTYHMEPVPGYGDIENEYKKAMIDFTNAKTKTELEPRGDTIDDKLKRANLEQTLADKKRREADAEEAKTPAGMLKKLPSEAHKSIGLIASALKNTTDYESVFNKGERQGLITPQTPVLGMFKGSTPVDEARVQMSEAIGRLNSGGAIGKDEEQRFYKMIPTSADDDETARRKLANFRQEMELKLSAYGVKPENLDAAGFNADLLGYGKNKQAQTQSGTSTNGLVGNMVKVSNGKETLMVPKDKAMEAAKDGYQVVQ